RSARRRRRRRRSAVPAGSHPGVRRRGFDRRLRFGRPPIPWPSRGTTGCHMFVTVVRHLRCCWNWKSALLSACLRSPLYLAAAFQSGFRAAAVAGTTDALFRLAIAGVAGALTQQLAQVRPRWASTLTAVIAIPLVAHTAEAVVHATAATPHWREAFRASV